MLYWPTKVSQHRVEQDTTIHRGYCWRYKTSYEGSKRLKCNRQNTRRNSKEIKAINKTYWNKTTSCLEEQTNQKKLTYKYMQAKVINIKMRAVDGLLRASVIFKWFLTSNNKEKETATLSSKSIINQTHRNSDIQSCIWRRYDSTVPAKGPAQSKRTSKTWSSSSCKYYKGRYEKERKKGKRELFKKIIQVPLLAWML